VLQALGRLLCGALLDMLLLLPLPLLQPQAAAARLAPVQGA
jgi:hypothetical protein